MLKRTKGGTLLSQVHQVSSRVWNRILRNHGLEDFEGARGRVIFALWKKDGVPMKYLCEKTSLDKSTMTGIISRLERDGLIERGIDKNDKRTSVISLKEENLKLTSSISGISAEMNGIFYSNFSDEEIVQFENYLERILENCKAAEN